MGLVSWMYLHLRELMFTLGLESSTVRLKHHRVIYLAAVSRILVFILDNNNVHTTQTS
ncbi:unnamed protein product [Schistosoma mattheei]|uniref:Uncharacterized protein n=1 Tax=Schistosoma mattheei TaxID=31246 RepID=A0A3P8FU44_9TREM|nr:unnamed protein product [Schistosoma mattheei]